MAKRSLFFGVLVIALAFVFFLGSCKNTTTEDPTFALSAEPSDGSAGMYDSVRVTAGAPAGNAPGTSVTVTAEAKSDYQFVKWSNNIVGYGSVSTESSYSFPIFADTSLYAVFKPNVGTNPDTIFPEMAGILNATENGIAVKIVMSRNYLACIYPVPYDEHSGSGKYTREGNVGIMYKTRDGKDEVNGGFTITSATTGTAYSDGRIYRATKEEDSESRVANGTLTVTGLPGAPFYPVFDVFVTTVTSKSIDPSNPKADLYDHTKLRAYARVSGVTAIPLVWFNTTGDLDTSTSYAVVISGNGRIDYKENVSFTSGSATIDYDAMTSWQQ